jgi:hypothetical protein
MNHAMAFVDVVVDVAEEGSQGTTLFSQAELKPEGQTDAGYYLIVSVDRYKQVAQT